MTGPASSHLLGFLKRGKVANIRPAEHTPILIGLDIDPLLLALEQSPSLPVAQAFVLPDRSTSWTESSYFSKVTQSDGLLAKVAQ